MNTSRISVSLTSDANFLALNILESLLSKNCQAFILTDEENKWQKITGHLANKSRFQIVNNKHSETLPDFNYSIFCGGFISKEDAYKSLEKFANNKSLSGSKKLIILPFESFLPDEDGRINLSDTLTVIYMGDLFGPRLDIESDLLPGRALSEILANGKLSLAVGEVIYPVFVGDAARTVTKWLFSFGPYGKTIFLLGTPVSGTDFWAANKRIVENIKLQYDSNVRPRYVPKNYEKKFIPVNLNFALTETYKWITKPSMPKPVVRKTVRKFRFPKYFTPAMLSVIFVLIFPILMILIASGLIFFSYKDVLKGKGDAAISKILVAKTLFVIGRGESKALSYIPLAGLLYKETNFISNIGQKVSDMSVVAVPTVKAANTTFNNILGDSVYDPSVASIEISSAMDILYREASAVEAETESAAQTGAFSAKALLAHVNFNKIGNFFIQGKVLATKLPDLLGKGERKTYLILFQNNMELRPTGGFIGSFGILTFDGGRMTDLAVSDVYSADGQLKGHVEPPEPIKTYLNEANWWLRDSNWDPDFPTSARRAEWFLDKEMGQKVDGVLALDLRTIIDALKITGPVFLADYNLDITADNLYQKTQAEATANFFPGSRLKASFLTALSRNLIGEVEKLGERQKFFVLALFLKDFEDRHVQVYLHDEATQEAVSRLSWGGEVATPECGRSCYADLIGEVEANVGDNKANYFISRNVSLEINLDKNLITRKLSINLKNIANTGLGPSGNYKTHIRTFIPDGATLISVKALTGENEEDLPVSLVESHGRQEAGAYVEVLGGQTKTIEFAWQTSFSGTESPGAYGLYVRKQAGVGDDPWHIFISVTDPSLTKPGVYKYNTILARDYFLRIK